MSAAVAAITFVVEKLSDDHDAMQFLGYWMNGDFDVLRRNWPEAPEEVYIGADPLHPQTKLERDAAEDAERWQAFRARDEFEDLDFTAFRDQFREDADAVIDAAIAKRKEI